jgi:hypothetical protein
MHEERDIYHVALLIIQQTSQFELILRRVWVVFAEVF